MSRPNPLPGSLVALLIATAPVAAMAVDPQQLVRVLEKRECKNCDLSGADLVQADLRDAHLRGARLQRANMSGALLDGADLREADLSFTSLAGASLQGADLRGSRLYGTDLRQANLSGALLDPGSLSGSHWQQAHGIAINQQSYAELHNAGVAAANAGRYPDAETYFGAAIFQKPEAAISWVARGISRTELGKTQLASQDFEHAAMLYKQIGETNLYEQLIEASRQLTDVPASPESKNGAGIRLMNGAAAAFQILGPLALKALLPMAL